MNEVMMRGQNRMEESFAKSWLCYKSVRKYGRLARMLACRSYYPSAKDGNWYVWLRRHSSRKSIMPWACCMQQPSWSNEPQHCEHRYVKNHAKIMGVYMFVCLRGVCETYGFVDTRQENRSCPGPAACINHLGAMSHCTMGTLCQKSSENCRCLFVCLFERGLWYIWLHRRSSRKWIMPWACCMQQPSWSNEPQH